MPKYPEKKVKNYIEKRIKYIENYARKYVKVDCYFPDDDEILNYEKIKGIKLIDLKFNKPDLNYKEYTDQILYDLEFYLLYKNTKYTFNVSNYYFYKNENELIVEDILQNISDLISKFRFLLENEEYIFDNDMDSLEDEEDDEMTIDDVADSCGFYIDDDGHWVPKEDDFLFDDFDEISMFKDNLNYENGCYIYNDIDDNGSFQWKY